MREKASAKLLGGLLVLAVVIILVVVALPLFNSIISNGPVDNAGSSSSLVTAIEETPSGIEVKTIQAGQGGEILVNGNAVENIPTQATGKTYNIKNVTRGDTVSVKPNQTDKIQQKYQVECSGANEEKVERDVEAGDVATYSNTRKGDVLYISGHDITMTGTVTTKTSGSVVISNDNQTETVQLDTVFSRFEELSSEYYCEYSEVSSGGSSGGETSPQLSVDNPLIVLDTFEEWNTNKSFDGVKSRNAHVGNRTGDGFFSMDDSNMTYSVYASKNISIPNASTRNDSEITTVGFTWQELSDTQKIKAGLYVKGPKEGKLLGASNDEPFIIDGNNTDSSGVATFTTNATEFDVTEAKLVAVIRSDGLSSSPKLDKFVAAHNSSLVSTNDTAPSGPVVKTVSFMDTESEFNSETLRAYQGRITTKYGGNGRFTANKSKDIAYVQTVEYNFTDMFGHKIIPKDITMTYEWNKSSDMALVYMGVDNQSRSYMSYYNDTNFHRFTDSSGNVTMPVKDNLSHPVSHMRYIMASGGEPGDVSPTHADIKRIRVRGSPEGSQYVRTERTLPRIDRIVTTKTFEVDTVSEWESGNINRAKLVAKNVTVNGRDSDSLIYDRGYVTPSHYKIGGTYDPYIVNFENSWDGLDRLENGDFISSHDSNRMEYIYSNGSVRWNQSVSSKNNYNVRTLQNQTFVEFGNSTGYYIRNYNTGGALENTLDLGSGVKSILEITSDSVYFSHGAGGSGRTALVKFDRSSETEIWNTTVDIESLNFGADTDLENDKVFYGGRDSSTYDIEAGRINATTGDKELSSETVGSRFFYNGWVEVNNGSYYLNRGYEQVKKFSNIYSNSFNQEWSRSYSEHVDVKFGGDSVYIYEIQTGSGLERVNASTGTEVWNSSKPVSAGLFIGKDTVYFSGGSHTTILNKTDGSEIETYPMGLEMMVNDGDGKVYGMLRPAGMDYSGWFDLKNPDTNNLVVDEKYGDQLYTLNTTDVEGWNVTNLTITLTDDNLHLQNENIRDDNLHLQNENIRFLLLSNESKNNLYNQHSMYGAWAAPNNINLQSIESYTEGKHTFNATTSGCSNGICAREEPLKNYTQLRVSIDSNKLDEPVGVDAVNITSKVVIGK